MGENRLRTRAEVKNVNSVRFVMQAIEYEAERQIAVYDSGGDVVQETRLYDSGRGETRSMRVKEFAHDYRYFPDPDLLPLRLEPAMIERIRETLPELPDQRKQRFIADFGVPAYNAAVLVAEKEIGEYFEEFASLTSQMTGEPLIETGTKCSNWLISELFGVLAKKKNYRRYEHPTCRSSGFIEPYS